MSIVGENGPQIAAEIVERFRVWIAERNKANDWHGAKAACCVCEFHEQRYTLTRLHTNALTHAYPIAVHKGQGSQFERPIVVIRKSRLLEQSLIYTALTCGVEQVVLIGDWNSACAAILAPAKATKRHVNLLLFLNLAVGRAQSGSL